MTDDEGVSNEMSPLPTPRREPARLDDDTAARILDGTVTPADAPPGYAGVVELLAAAGAPPAVDELAGEDAARAAFSAVRQGVAAAPRAQHRRGRWVLVPGVAAAVLLVGTVVGSVTGSLPGIAQDAAHDVLDEIGVTVPNGEHETAAEDGPRGADTAGEPTATSILNGPKLTAPAAVGLCQAYAAGGGGKAHATAFKTLAAAAAAAPGGTDGARIAAFCDFVITDEPTITTVPGEVPSPGNSNPGGNANPGGNGNGNPGGNGNAGGNDNGNNAGGNGNGNAGGNGNGNGNAGGNGNGNAGGNGNGNGGGRP